MNVYKQEGSKYWTADFTIEGRRFRQSTKQTTKAKAMEVAAEFLRQAQRGEASDRRRVTPTLSEFTGDTFLPYIEKLEKKESTKLYYRKGCRLLSGTTIAVRPIDAITEADIDVQTFPGSGSNANRALRTLKRMLHYAVKEKVIETMPRVNLRKERKRSHVFNPQTEQAILSVAGEDGRDAFLVSQDSGMRPEEVVSISWDDVLWDKNLIFVPAGKTANARRHVPLSDRVRGALRARLDRAEAEAARKGQSISKWAFSSPRKEGAHISYFTVARQFSKARAAAGVPKELVLYSARHTFATDLLDKTGNIALVQKVLGHESIATTGRYLHPSLKGIAALVNQRNVERARDYDGASRHSLRHSPTREEFHDAVSC